jgi:hypothetical protein
MSVSTTSVVPRTRPLGVAILAILIGIYGFLTFILGLLLAVLSSYSGFPGLGLPTHIAGTSLFLSGIIVLIIGLIIMGLAVGLWHLRMWALVLTLLFLLIELVLYGLAGDFISFGFIVSLILLIYLLAVSRHFA